MLYLRLADPSKKMLQSPVIRAATVADAQILTDLASRTFVESHGHSAPKADIDDYISNAYSPQTFEEELRAPGNLYHLIFYGSNVAGYSKIVPDAEHNSITVLHITKLERLYILKDFYGTNCGSALFEFNLQLSKKYAQQGMWLYVWKENARAIKFYLKKGFEITGNYDFKISETHSNPNHLMFLRF